MCEIDEKLEHLFENNKKWVSEKLNEDENFFKKLANIHSPKYLWIGCSDARVPANTIVGLKPGEIFVHRNIGNVVSQTDTNIQTVIHYAVQHLKVKHIIVTGHYDCGAIKATLSSERFGRVEDWLYHIKAVVRENETQLKKLDTSRRIHVLCELNVKSQVRNLVEMGSVLSAWKNKQDLTVHGWIYNVQDGFLKSLNCTITSSESAKKLEKCFLIS